MKLVQFLSGLLFMAMSVAIDVYIRDLINYQPVSIFMAAGSQILSVVFMGAGVVLASLPFIKKDYRY